MEFKAQKHLFLANHEFSPFSFSFPHINTFAYLCQAVRVQPFPQVRELFTKIEADGLKIVLASSARTETIAYYKQLLNIENLIDGATSTDDVAKSKPEPDIFLAALEKLEGISTEEVIVVGDSPYDAIAASKASLRTIGVLCGGFERETLTQAGCVAIYQDPADLLNNYPRFLDLDEVG